MATSTFSSRSAQTMNSMVIKPMLRKSIHKKSASHDIVRETAKTDAGAGDHEMKTMRSFAGDTSSLSSGTNWVPHEGTGIYYPKGQEKVMQDVPPPPRGSHVEDELINWFS